MSRPKNSKEWLQEHFSDDYVKKAKKEGYRSRAVYKLIELNDRDKFIKPGMTVIDLGAAPGGWSQVAAKYVGRKGRVIALDRLPMDAIADVAFIEGDFMEDETLKRLLDTLGESKADIVMSDMAPNTSGIPSVDQPRSMYLIELAFDLAQQVLKPGGTFLTKVFQGSGFDEILEELRSNFKKVVIRKPKASRSRSKETYILATGYTL